MATETKTYNGWTNYETWLVNLWLNNDQGTQREMENIANHTTRPDYGRADMLKEYVQDILPDLEGMAADLLNAALSEVDWLEIVQNHQEDE